MPFAPQARRRKANPILNAVYIVESLGDAPIAKQKRKAINATRSITYNLRSRNVHDTTAVDIVKSTKNTATFWGIGTPLYRPESMIRPPSVE
jgi:hypothetical protein